MAVGRLFRLLTGPTQPENLIIHYRELIFCSIKEKYLVFRTVNDGMLHGLSRSRFLALRKQKLLVAGSD